MLLQDALDYLLTNPATLPFILPKPTITFGAIIHALQKFMIINYGINDIFHIIWL